MFGEGHGSALLNSIGVFFGLSPVNKNFNIQRFDYTFWQSSSGSTIERFHVTSQSRENHTGGHFGVQLNGGLVCCTMCVQNAAQTWQLMDLPHKYVRYRYPVHVICET